MGWAKEREYELFTRGFGETGDQAVCLECLTDEGLVGEVRDILDEPQCSFCGAKAGDDGAPIAVDFERFMYVVMDGVNFIYGLANDEGVPFDEGDWVGGPVLDSYDVVEDICGYAAKENVVEAIQEVVDHNAWTYRNYQLLQPDRAMRLGWDEFCQRIKHETRFLFMAIPQSPSLMPDEFTSVEFMARLMEIISTSGALVKVPAGRVFWRGRLVGDSKLPRYGAKELGSPPPDKASANRMSPAGISMFYGSDDIETVVAEIGAHGSRSHAAVGSFETTKPLTMLNLAALPAVNRVSSPRVGANRITTCGSFTTSVPISGSLSYSTGVNTLIMFLRRLLPSICAGCRRSKSMASCPQVHRTKERTVSSFAARKVASTLTTSWMSRICASILTRCRS